MTDDPDRPAARLHVAAPLGPDNAVTLDGDQAHYLRAVLRLAPGDTVALFNGRDGEWLAAVEALAKSGGRLACRRQTRAQRAEPDLWLIFAPLKHGRIDWLVEKATELGVAALLPVITRHTMVARVNGERLQAHAREAAEQTERLSVPQVHAPQRLEALLAGFPSGRRLLVCDERGAAEPIAEAVRRLGPQPGGWAVMTGPEGGFAAAELDAVKNLPFVSRVGLGPRILRADTAALSALAVLQALAGDWRMVQG